MKGEKIHKPPKSQSNHLTEYYGLAMKIHKRLGNKMLDRQPSTVKAVIWDNLGVLSFTVGGSYLDILVDRLKVPESDVMRVLTSHESDLLDLGKMSKDEYYDYVIQDLGLPENKKPLLDLSEENIRYDKVLHEYIGELRPHYKTMLLSVMPLYIQEFLRSIWPEFELVFDHVIISCEVHLLKPDPKIYRLALEKLDCKPEEAVFVDDSIGNVEAARALGINSILYQNRDQVIKDLERILFV